MVRILAKKVFELPDGQLSGRDKGGAMRQLLALQNRADETIVLRTLAFLHVLCRIYNLLKHGDKTRWEEKEVTDAAKREVADMLGGRMKGGQSGSNGKHLRRIIKLPGFPVLDTPGNTPRQPKQTRTEDRRGTLDGDQGIVETQDRARVRRIGQPDAPGGT